MSKITNLGKVIGPQGPQGPAGADGVDGIDGQQGPQGEQGPQGLAGANGRDAINKFVEGTTVSVVIPCSASTIHPSKTFTVPEHPEYGKAFAFTITKIGFSESTVETPPIVRANSSLFNITEHQFNKYEYAENPRSNYDKYCIDVYQMYLSSSNYIDFTITLNNFCETIFYFYESIEDSISGGIHGYTPYEIALYLTPIYNV